MTIEKLGDIPDMERYLREDCYCPGEIYSIDGFFYQMFDAESKCKVIAESEGRIAVVAKSYDFKYKTDDESAMPQAILFWRDDQDYPGRIVSAKRVDATESNIGILRTIVEGGKPDGRKIDEFEPGSTAMALNDVMSIADFVMVG